MDKETLSNYGWIVVLVLILAVMLALASPFGSFVSTAIKDVTGGFWDVNSVALKGVGISTEDVDFPVEPASCGIEGHYIGDDKGEHGIPVEDCKSGHTYTCECKTWTIPDGGTYTVKNKGCPTIYKGGEQLPCGYELRGGDVLVYEDYRYEYSGNDTWIVTVIDNTKTTYGKMIDSFADKPVAWLSRTFYKCTSLTEVPVIPNGVTNMGCTFMYCSSLTSVPAIPNGVTDMESTFYNCKSLTGTIEINANPTKYSYCFSGVDFEKQNLTLTGTSTMLDELGATGRNYCSTCNGKCLNNH